MHRSADDHQVNPQDRGAPSRPLIALAVGAACLAAGCTSDVTSVLATLSFDSVAYHPVALSVSVAVPEMQLVMNKSVAGPGGRALHDGDTFAVWLPDTVDGHRVIVSVTSAGDPPTLTGQGTAQGQRSHAVAMTIALSTGAGPADMLPATDGGSDAAAVVDSSAQPDATDAPPDMAKLPDQTLPADLTDLVDMAPGPDLTMPDLTMPDLLPAPDLTLPDLIPPPDLACTPGTTCAGGVESTCTAGGGVTTRNCPFGCDANTNACLTGDKCTGPGDVSMGGTFSGSTLGYTDDATGSCSAATGADLVTQFKLDNWRTVTFDTTGSAFDTVLYTRYACAGAAGTGELPLAGPCPGAGSGTSQMCNDDVVAGMTSSKLVECTLPPNIPFYTWLDSKGMGGKYQMSVQIGPVSTLNTCATAGNLLDGTNRLFSATTTGNVNNFTNTSGGCGDNGANAPEIVFFLAVPAARTLNVVTTSTFPHVVYVRPGCAGKELHCQKADAANSTNWNINLPAAGVYFLIVDGLNGATGTFSLQVQ